jgi:signal transduction histidine kinase
MVDRARVFTTSDLQDEKMVSLGKLAAMLAHELNNPASALVRSAERLQQGIPEFEAASRALGAARLPDAVLNTVMEARHLCLAAAGATFGRSPIEQADREDAIADWMDRHGGDTNAATALAESAVTLESLDHLAAALDPDTLHTALHWLVSGCTSKQLVSEIGAAAARIHTLVAAVKSYTYMDQATAPKPVDIRQGLADTLAMLNAKARSRTIGVRLEIDGELPKPQGFGSELNQVWFNLIDNALDAAKQKVIVFAGLRNDALVVRVVDDGGGVPPELRGRIFEMFFTTKPVGAGTGMGLDIARRIVLKHRGEITLESEPGRTEFQVTLPIGAKGL